MARRMTRQQQKAMFAKNRFRIRSGIGTNISIKFIRSNLSNKQLFNSELIRLRKISRGRKVTLRVSKV